MVCRIILIFDNCRRHSTTTYDSHLILLSDGLRSDLVILCELNPPDIVSCGIFQIYTNGPFKLLICNKWPQVFVIHWLWRPQPTLNLQHLRFPLQTCAAQNVPSHRRATGARIYETITPCRIPAPIIVMK